MKKSNQEILKMIYDNSTYNEEKREYQISKQLRDSLNLSKKRWRRINTICKLNGITIEYPNKPLIDLEGVELFEKYNDIKSKIENETNPVELEYLEKERIEIRNKIAIVNLELIKEIINRRINGKDNILEINNQLTKDDLYQYGYEVLLHYLDTQYLYKETIKKDLNNILMIYIQNKIAICYGCSNEYLNNLKKLKKYLNNLSNDTIDIELLSKQLELPIDTIINLLNLEYIENPINIDTLELIDDTLEKNMFKKYQQEYLNKLLDTLQVETQKQVLILTYGINGEDIYLDEEISKKVNLSKKSISGTRYNAINKLRYPSRLKYLLEILDYEKDLEPTFDIYKEVFTQKNRDLRYLERFLLLKLDKEELMDLIKTLNLEQQTALLLYLNYNDLVEPKYLEKSKDKYYFYQESKEKALFYIRNRIEELYVKNNPNESIQNYFDYLMYNYLNKPKKLYRTK